jgi:hypothetical protein
LPLSLSHFWAEDLTFQLTWPSDWLAHDAAHDPLRWCRAKAITTALGQPRRQLKQSEQFHTANQASRSIPSSIPDAEIASTIWSHIFFFVRSSVVFCPSISFAEIIVKHNTPKQNRKVTYFALRTFVAEFIIKRGTSEKDRNRALLLYEFCFAEFIVKRGTPEENRKVGDFALRIFFCWNHCKT